MKLTVMIFVALTYQLSECATFRGRLEELTDHKNQCYFKMSDNSYLYVKAGGFGYDGKNCLKYSCFKINGTLNFEGYSCGTISVEPPCNVTRITGGRYPLCCPKVVCPSF